MDRPRALLFDLDDTLISAYANRGDAWRSHLEGFAAALHPLESTAVAAAVAAAAARFWAEPGVTATNRYDLQAVRRANVASAFVQWGIDDIALSFEIADAFTAKRRRAHHLMPDTVPVLRACRARGFKTGLVTNGGTVEQRNKLSRFDLDDLFDSVAIAEEVGVEKPDPAIFEHALDALGVSASAAWMVGDHVEWDIAGAQAVGARAVWLNLERRAAPANIRPDATISGLGEILTLLDAV